MSQSDSDRTVHAYDANDEVVRYDRAGKWWLESRRGDGKRVPLTLGVAAQIGKRMLKTGEVAFGRRGGGGVRPKGARLMLPERTVSGDELRARQTLYGQRTIVAAPIHPPIKLAAEPLERPAAQTTGVDSSDGRD